jgi:hypothetical protein
VDLAPLLVAALFVAAVTLALQIGDAITLAVDARRVRDDDDPELLTRNRIRELSWTIAITATLAVIVAFGAVSAARFVWDLDNPGLAFVTLILVTLLVFGIGVVAVIAIVRRERPTYARIRRDLRDRANHIFDEAELDEFDARLADADRQLARRSSAAPALRVVSLVIVLAITVPVGVASLVAAGADGAGPGAVWVGILLFVAAGLSIAAFVVAVRSSVVRDAAVEAVLADQRAEVIALLERARIPHRRGVPGLRDRVTRALAILREQQK